MDNAQIKQLLERVGQALSTGDIKGVSNCWEVPGLIISDEGATALADSTQIENLFAQANNWYRSRGLTSTKPELEQVDMLSDKLAAVDVRWPAFDSSGKEQASERSHYIVQLGPDGQPRIRAALTRTK